MIFWLETAKRLDAIAQAGLTYSSNVYDLERFEEIRKISHAMLHEYTGTPIEKIPELFSNVTGYQTPKVDIRGVIFRNEKILLVKEKLDSLWALPGGWADIGYSPKEMVVKEVSEEAGLVVEPTRLLAVFDMKFHDHPPSPFHIYKFFILCSDGMGNPVAGQETLDAAFFAIDSLPPLSLGRNTSKQILTMHQLSKNPDADILFD
jgi:ADP-ribose pyrophosphatase YjhB (NUDIX family)